MVLSQNTPRINQIEQDLSNAYDNIAINGNMDFWQRGVSTTIDNNVAYTADRWAVFHSHGGGNTVTATRDADVPTLAQTGFNCLFSLKVTNNHNIAPTGNTAISYQVEGYDYSQLHGGHGRIQFWFRSSVVGDYALSLRNDTNSRSYVSKITITQADTWQFFYRDIAFDNTGTWNFDHLLGLRAMISVVAPLAGQTNTLDQWINGNFNGITTPTNWTQTIGATLYLSQFAIIPGQFDSGVSLKFKRAGKSIANELQLCQRYYEKSYLVGIPPGTATGVGRVAQHAHGATSTGLKQSTAYYAVAKRVAPTVTIWDGNSNSNRVTIHTANVSSTPNHNQTVANVDAGGTNTLIVTTNSITGYDFYFNYAASAEL